MSPLLQAVLDALELVGSGALPPGRTVEEQLRALAEMADGVDATLCERFLSRYHEARFGAGADDGDDDDGEADVADLAPLLAQLTELARAPAATRRGWFGPLAETAARPALPEPPTEAFARPQGLSAPTHARAAATTTTKTTAAALRGEPALSRRVVLVVAGIVAALVAGAFFIGKRAARRRTALVAGSVGPRVVDGLEALTHWSSPTGVQARRRVGLGVVLSLDYARAKAATVSARSQLRVSMTRYRRVLLDVVNRAARPVKLSLLVVVEPGGERYDSEPVTLPAGRWRHALAFDLAARRYTRRGSDRKGRIPAHSRARVAALGFVVHDVPARGALWIDRLRLVDDRIFQRALDLPHGGSLAFGVSAADFDGDGDLDLFVAAEGGGRLYRNDGGDLVDATDEVSPHVKTLPSRCGLWADADGDGDLDLLLVQRLRPPALLIGERGGANRSARLVDRSAALPAVSKNNGEGAGWVDVDGDGRAEALISNGEHGLLLFRGPARPGGRFVDISADWGLGSNGLGRANGDYLALGDLDADGHVDFVYNVSHGLFARNSGSRFDRLEPSPRYQTNNRHKLGLALGDFDGDGRLDVFVPQRGASMLLLATTGDGPRFRDATAAAGELATMPPGAQSAAAGDVDGDGDLDLVVGFSGRPARLYLNNGRAVFVDASSRAGFTDFPATINATGMLLFDWDRDGDSDLLLNSHNGRALLLLSSLGPRRDRRRLRVLLGPRASTGARVEVRGAGAPQQILARRDVALARGMCAQGPAETSIALLRRRYRLDIRLSSGALVRRSVDLTKRDVVVDLRRGRYR